MFYETSHVQYQVISCHPPSLVLPSVPRSMKQFLHSFRPDIQNRGTEFPLAITATSMVIGEPVSAQVSDRSRFKPFFVMILAGF
jgi:hypothetical protein